MARKERLREYHRKRDLRRSGEPAGGRRRDGAPAFVVQRHEASTSHFDLRLEIDGVLVSWSVPKGPATDPAQRRLAVRTEDHPLDYLEFEGRIREGEYGGGTVVVWDVGSFDNLTEEPAERALERGHLRVRLHGHRLCGAYSLVRTRMGADRGQEQWLLVKKNDEGADRRREPARTQPESVLTGRRNDEL
ncbi:DNA polymerase ligase N-terminal domain-containing protein [Amycolatopsis aidingensis]|uniref:DNA polymerase ligase N-terminal domain-containing protein n=1 Tax=Amycolatopsis aidingensis TaxID=2842453 RepID=UPI001C0B9E01|nr:DNA polymerase ligase N-terminal domain-containing protein [Amycolatopsis aidingensis]